MRIIITYLNSAPERLQRAFVNHSHLERRKHTNIQFRALLCSDIENPEDLTEYYFVNPISTGDFGSYMTRGADLPPPSKNGCNGWEVQKLSWNLISYQD